jgi:uncharacterized protein (UPF0276 family)
LKAAHYDAALAESARPSFLEVHAENYLHAGGPAHRHLDAIRADYPLSFHGVGLSLAGLDPPPQPALAARRALLDRYESTQFSEHLAWSSFDGAFLNDLLPLAYTSASVARVAAHIDAAQNALGRRILIENPATYVQFESSTFEEPQFIAELVQRTGCGLLLDINNIVVSATNHGFDARHYLRGLPLDAVGEMHLAGHARRVDSNGMAFLIDSHDAAVQPETWDLFRFALGLVGPRPVLIEWDSSLPTWEGLLHEARIAERHLQRTAMSTVHAGV